MWLLFFSRGPRGKTWNYKLHCSVIMSFIHEFTNSVVNVPVLIQEAWQICHLCKEIHSLQKHRKPSTEIIIIKGKNRRKVLSDILYLLKSGENQFLHEVFFLVCFKMCDQSKWVQLLQINKCLLYQVGTHMSSKLHKLKQYREMCSLNHFHLVYIISSVWAFMN